MKAEKKHSAVLADLTFDEVSALFDYSTSISLEKGDILFKQGDGASSLYFVINGALSASLKKADGEAFIVGTVNSGQMVGEMGLLTKAPRSLSITALTSCELLELTADGFEHFMQESPRVMLNIIAIAINRAQQTINLVAEKPPGRYIALIGANENVNIELFLQELQQYTGADYLTANDFNGGKFDYIEALNVLEEKTNDVGVVLYHLPRSEAAWINACLHRATHIVIIADSTTSADFSSFFSEKFQESILQIKNKELVLLHHQGCRIQNTQRWLTQHNFTLHHHVHWHSAGDYQRLNRFLQGTATGLVLSGGAIRVWSQIGVLRSLREHNITIDAIGGTSGGALIAVLYLITANQDELVNQFSYLADELRKAFRLRKLVYPVISLFGLKKLEDEIERRYGNINIEDLSCAYYAVSSNMTKQIEHVHRSGSLAKAIRSTASLPGLTPPVLHNDELLCDGGVLNNLPTDHMRKLISPTGRLIAVDSAGSFKDSKQYAFPSSFTLVDTLFARNKYLYPQRNWPHFSENLLRALMLGASTKYRENLTLADICIAPMLDNFRMLDFKLDTAKRLMQLGYEEANTVLADE